MAAGGARRRRGLGTVADVALVGLVLLIALIVMGPYLYTVSPAPSWGNMLSEARYLVRDAFWISFFPGLLIGIAVLSANILGDGIRDRYDPRRGE